MQADVPRPSQLTSTRLFRAAVAVLVTGALAVSATAAAAPTGGVTATSAAATAKGKAKSKHKAKAKKPRKRKTARAQSTQTYVSDYSGPTGAIFHRRHSVGGPVRGAAPSRYEEEAWFEIDGGRRARTVGTVGPIDANGNFLSSGTSEDWSTPDFLVHLESGTSFPGAPGSYKRAGCPTQREAFRRSHGDLAMWEYNRVRRIYDRHLAGEQLPAGPVIDGHETITGEIRQSADASQTLYLDRGTGALRRIVNHDPWNGDVTVEYSVWEMIPAGGSAANLAGVLPATGVRDRSAEDCTQIAPFPVDTP